MAVNVATIEGLAAAYQTLKALAGEVQRLERLDRARDRADGPAPVRGDRSDIPPGGDQAGANRMIELVLVRIESPSVECEEWLCAVD